MSWLQDNDPLVRGKYYSFRFTAEGFVNASGSKLIQELEKKNFAAALKSMKWTNRPTGVGPDIPWDGQLSFAYLGPPGPTVVGFGRYQLEPALTDIAAWWFPGGKAGRVKYVGAWEGDPIKEAPDKPDFTKYAWYIGAAMLAALGIYGFARGAGAAAVGAA